MDGRTTLMLAANTLQQANITMASINCKWRPSLMFARPSSCTTHTHTTALVQIQINKHCNDSVEQKFEGQWHDFKDWAISWCRKLTFKNNKFLFTHAQQTIADKQWVNKSENKWVNQCNIFEMKPRFNDSTIKIHYTHNKLEIHSI